MRWEGPQAATQTPLAVPPRYAVTAVWPQMCDMAGGEEDIVVLSVGASMPVVYAIMGGELEFHSPGRCASECGSVRARRRQATTS